MVAEEKYKVKKGILEDEQKSMFIHWWECPSGEGETDDARDRNEVYRSDV